MFVFQDWITSKCFEQVCSNLVEGFAMTIYFAYFSKTAPTLLSPPTSKDTIICRGPQFLDFFYYDNYICVKTFKNRHFFGWIWNWPWAIWMVYSLMMKLPIWMFPLSCKLQSWFLLLEWKEEHSIFILYPNKNGYKSAHEFLR